MQDFPWPPAPDDLDGCEVVVLDGDEAPPDPRPAAPLPRSWPPVPGPRLDAGDDGGGEDFDWPPPESPLPVLPPPGEPGDGPIPVLLHVPPPRRTAGLRRHRLIPFDRPAGPALRLVLAAFAAGLSLALAGRAAVPVFSLHSSSDSRSTAVLPTPVTSPTPRLGGGNRPPAPAGTTSATPPGVVRRQDSPPDGPPAAATPGASHEERQVRGATNEEAAAIERALGQLTTAYARLDSSAVQAVWPTVDEAALSRAFQALDRQDIVFERCAFTRRGGTATAACAGRATWVSRASPDETWTEARRWTFTLQQDVTAWRIVEAVAH